jgi:hypothetical protein
MAASDRIETELRGRALDKHARDLAEVIDRCDLPTDRNIEKVFACWRKLSDNGNAYATTELAQIYGASIPPESEDYSDLDNILEGYREKLNITKSTNHASELLILAIKQGDFGNEYIPPKPYAWKLGMSDFQVRNSVAGEPENITTDTSDYQYSETWYYPNVVLVFDRIIGQTNVLTVIRQFK